MFQVSAPLTHALVATTALFEPAVAPPHGWVGAASLGTGATLALIALVRRGRATLLRRRRLRGGPAHR